MADQIRVQTSVSYIQETPPSNTQLLNTIQTQLHESYNHGVQRLGPNIIDYQLSINVNMVVLNCDTDFVVKLGSTTNPQIVTKSFMYNGEVTDVYLSNPTTNPIEIQYMSSAV